MSLIRVQSVSAIERLKVGIRFTDGTEKVIDLDAMLQGPIFEAVRSDPALFRAVRVDPDLGTIVWPNGADIDPEVLYYGLEAAEERYSKRPTRSL